MKNHLWERIDKNAKKAMKDECIIERMTGWGAIDFPAGSYKKKLKHIKI